MGQDTTTVERLITIFEARTKGFSTAIDSLNKKVNTFQKRAKITQRALDSGFNIEDIASKTDKQLKQMSQQIVQSETNTKAKQKADKEAFLNKVQQQKDIMAQHKLDEIYAKQQQKIKETNFKKTQALERKLNQEVKKAEREIAQQQQKQESRIKQMQAGMLGFGMATLFTGMAVRQLGMNIMSSLVNTYMKATDEQNAFKNKILGVQASFEFLKFSIFDALSQSELVMNLIDGFIQLVNRVSEFINLHPNVAKLIGLFGLGAIVLGTISMVIGQITMGFLGVFGAAEMLGVSLTGVFSNLWTKIVSIFSSTLTLPFLIVIGALIIGAIQSWKDNFANFRLWIAVLWEGIKNIMMGYMGIISNIFGIFIALFTGDTEGFYEHIKGLFHSVIQLITGMVQMVIGAVVSLGISALKAVIGIYTIIYQTWEKIFSITGEWWDKVLIYFKDIWDDITDGFTDLTDSAVDWGKDLIRNLWEGIKSMGSWIKDKLMFWKDDNIGDAISYDKAKNDMEAQRWGFDLATNFGKGLSNGIIDDNIKQPIQKINQDILPKQISNSNFNQPNQMINNNNNFNIELNLPEITDLSNIKDEDVSVLLTKLKEGIEEINKNQYEDIILNTAGVTRGD